MSSIYRKGRDGYYYYQTYVYNPDSKKRDKRIFHALGTKDSIEAKTKQSELDIKYQKESSTHSNSLNTSYKFIIKPNIAITLGLLTVAIILFYYSNTDNDDYNTENQIIIKNPEVINSRNKFITKSNEVSSKTKTLQKENIIPRPKLIDNKVVIPKYTIERVERMSGVFEQGKVYVTIDKSYSKESQLLLCEELRSRFNEFSNIVICIYSDNKSGKMLAAGNDEIVSIEEQKQSWLSMYTYNLVEGKYFDDNPSGYLGIN